MTALPGKTTYMYIIALVFKNCIKTAMVVALSCIVVSLLSHCVGTCVYMFSFGCRTQHCDTCMLGNVCVSKALYCQEVYVLRTTTPSAAMGLISSRDFVDIIINVNNDKMVGTMGKRLF